ncbi:hypothetical protein An16g04800 [Aspergillus niger]|uniref:Uncharacterized protein n=2 Tax=Aspergillus niger TaxID=5061 RepID=A2R7U6_ASPNC|nr:hypothetical protein An16g04800 [Aspergillus niger]CAK42907.1 hypothetical protein An16g04800 [Aspergillus niger]
MLDLLFPPSLLEGLPDGSRDDRPARPNFRNPSSGLGIKFKGHETASDRQVIFSRGTRGREDFFRGLGFSPQPQIGPHPGRRGHKRLFKKALISSTLSKREVSKNLHRSIIKCGEEKNNHDSRAALKIRTAGREKKKH